MGEPDDRQSLLDSLQRAIDAVPESPRVDVRGVGDAHSAAGPTGALSVEAPAVEAPGAGGAGGDGPSGEESDEADSGGEDQAFGEATKRAYAILALRDHSRAELRQKLVRKGCEAHIVDRLLTRLDAAGLVDDARFAEQFVRSQREGRGKSLSAITRALRDKGVSDEHVRTATEELGDDFPLALAAARKKAAGTRGLAHDVRLRRTLGLLARRGFGGSVGRRAAEQALAEEPGDDRD
ncbi:regulatory protein RecX [Brevibacterium jeotgali]|uniref:Regulatory protein RecX n=1 Tax=Brevibacterium jeotgali TaxID=1262550 RepID=A0A2H1L367_9MICO|nr:regulatory protein RecX [Brevibacterium jeotgali]TWC02544.1 regulatory protein [Brevibacterium jeotgali]SMY11336.1 regulatory protein [Brevibacterium jeotgali]